MPESGVALGWGALAASSLVIGVLLAFARAWPRVVLGLVMAFGAGALISAVSFELTEEGIQLASGQSVGLGLAIGALTFFLLDRRIEGRSAAGESHSGQGGALALGSLLDGVPEQLVLGIGLAGGEPVSLALLVAIFISNLPEGIASASDMTAAGSERGKILRLFLGVFAACTLATLVGYAVADNISNELQATVNGFAAGALLVMLIDSMIPEAVEKAGLPCGLFAVLGFAVATWLSDL